MKFQILLSLALAFSLQASNINIVNLVSRDVTRFKISQGSSSETFELTAGTTSGKLQAPVPTTISCLDVPDSEKSFAAPERDILAIFYEVEQKPRWHVVPSEPTEDLLSLRVLNLSMQPVDLTVSGTKITVASLAIQKVEPIDRPSVKIRILETDVQKRFKPADPLAGLAIITKNADAWSIDIVSDL